MKKFTLVKNKIVFLIVIAVIFLIAIGVILLLVFIENKKTVSSEPTLQERINDLATAKAEKPVTVDQKIIKELLTAKLKASERIEVDEQTILNLSNQKK